MTWTWILLAILVIIFGFAWRESEAFHVPVDTCEEEFAEWKARFMNEASEEFKQVGKKITTFRGN